MLNMGAVGPGKEDEVNPTWLSGTNKPRGWTSSALEAIKSLSSNERKVRKEAETNETDAWGWAGSLCLKIWENRQPT